MVEEPADPVRELGDARQSAAQLRHGLAQVGEQVQDLLVQELLRTSRSFGVFLLCNI